MAKKVDLLIIDPQYDFCDPRGTLFVPGADEDMNRLTGFIKNLGGKFNDIHVTLDSHHTMDIAHPLFWKDSAGNNPAPFTTITVQDVEQGKWLTTIPHLNRRGLDYVRALEANGRYPLVIWPYHCLIGSKGYQVMPSLFEALAAWERTEQAMVDYVTKGSNMYTEHYSAVQADVPDPADPTTQINTPLIRTLEEADLVLVAGEAGSHCLANTVRDIAENFRDDSYIRKLVLLEDVTSPVTGFEALQEDFVQDMTLRGMRTATTKDFVL